MKQINHQNIYALAGGMNMFQTSELQKCITRKEQGCIDFQLWELIELSHSEPWLFIAYTNKDILGKNIIRMHEFISCYSRIVSLAEISDINFECIMLASPGDMNFSGSWRFDEVNEIWKGEESDSECEQAGVVYVLKDGSRLVHSLHNNEKTLSNLQRVYPPQ